MSEVDSLVDRSAQRILADLISQRSQKLFKKFRIEVEFLKVYPDTQSECAEYQKTKEVIKNFKVINDVAEKGIKLVQKYEKSVCKDKDQKQFLLQVN